MPFLWPFLFLSFLFPWDFFSILRIKYNEIKWNKNTATHSTFTDIQSFDLWKPEIFYLYISPTHCRPDRVFGTETLPSSFPANPLNSPFIFNTCMKSPLFFTAAAMSYHCQSSHYISAVLSNFSLSLCFPQHPAPFLGFFVKWSIWSLSLPLPWCFTSALWLAKLFILYLSYFR